MTDELKSCPFCGEPAKIIESHRYDASVDPTPPHWKVSCATIGCNGAAINIWRQSPEDAIAAWNSRHESDELPEWFVNKLNESIIDCGLLEAELKDDNDIEEAVRVGRRANTLRWVLTLRKSEEK